MTLEEKEYLKKEYWQKEKWIREKQEFIKQEINKPISPSDVIDIVKNPFSLTYEILKKEWDKV